MNFLILFCVVASASVVYSSISDQCLRCICEVESGCRAIGCHWDVYSNSCGYFQIKQGYWTDCGSPGHSMESCADNYNCASGCVRSYMDHYIKYNGCADTCESYARMHNGGPNGCKSSHHHATDNYWRLVQAKGCS
ncbi:lysozyme 2 [Crassostrea virginica]|uniref:Lysozyme 2 n=2 Tax=Crassostrea virginica TaxID=6565 RepID=LYS2_CRAVI|nr:lysozyme 2 [Crassostrea virginica]Q1XG90.1 RecName: Full=Lysozyme 2; AltName: Full=1,4-beta-N-acetylmuramidase 2; AltName: Full=Invertebrate-type lysozyme 2; AltName: Full=cv-lysozyme 2; Flags: Precursor [Crassostrea virginica]BAE93114.1 lysozyme 2 [Crassostrea virginica]